MIDEVTYLLTQIADEGCEVAQRAHKAIHFGLDEVQPGQIEPNSLRLAGEIIDFLASVDVLQEAGLIRLPNLEVWKRAKKAKIEKFMTYSRSLGQLAAHKKGEA